MSIFLCKLVIVTIQNRVQRIADSNDYYDRMFAQREEELFCQRGY